MWYLHTMNSAIKNKDKFELFVVKWMYTETITLSDSDSQAQINIAWLLLYDKRKE